MPVESKTLLRYVTFLSRSLKPQSIRGYLSAIRLLHLELGYSNPLEQNFQLQTLLKGIEATQGSPPRRKLPITLDILSRIAACINFENQLELTFYAACLLGFFSFFRKSTLLTQSVLSHDCRKDLCRRDIKILDNGALVRVKYTKTLRNFSRVFEVPIPKIQNSILCPVTALSKVLGLNTGNLDAPLFSYWMGRTYVPLTNETFSKLLNHYLSRLSLDPSKYSGHSLRRGGATFALACGLPAEVIQSQGGWSSDCYKRYIDMPLEMRFKCCQILGSNVK